MSSGMKVAIIVICLTVGVPVVLGVVGAVLFISLAGGSSHVVHDDMANWNKARIEMLEIQKSLNTYALTHDGEYPDSLDKLTDFRDGPPRDPFTGQNYIYFKRDFGFELKCLGKDQMPGGDGPPDEDIRITERGQIGQYDR